MCFWVGGAFGARGEELVDTAIYARLSRAVDSLLGDEFEPTGLEWGVSLARGRYLDVGFTMHANVYYRVVVVSTLGDNAVRYRLFDSDRNVLHDSQEYNDASWWDFLVTSTVAARLSLYGKPTEGAKDGGYLLVRVAFCRTDRPLGHVKK